MNFRTATRFMLVGLSGTLVDFSLFALLHTQLGISSLLANTISYSAGILNNYLLHRHWTFSHRPQRGAGLQFSQFMGVSLSALVINNLIVLLFAPFFGTLFPDSAVGIYLAKLCAIGVGMVWNFLANHLWIFRAGPVSAHGSSTSLNVDIRASLFIHSSWRRFSPREHVIRTGRIPRGSGDGRGRLLP